MKKTYITPLTENHLVASIRPIATSYEDIHAGGTGVPSTKQRFDVDDDDNPFGIDY